MNGLILSAGLGTRLKPLTDKTPKPMIKVGGEPVLAHLVDHLHFYGVENIILNLHHLPLKIMAYFGSEVLYTYEPELFGEEGTILSLASRFPFIRDNYLVVMNGDTLTNIKLDRMMRLANGKSVRHMDNGVYTGTMILSPDYFLGDKTMLEYYDSEASWIDIGTPEGLKKARRNYEKFNHLP